MATMAAAAVFSSAPDQPMFSYSGLHRRLPHSSLPRTQLELRQLSLTEETLNTAISRQADAVKASKVTIAAVETKLTAEKHKLAASVSLLSALGKKLQELVRVVDRR